MNKCIAKMMSSFILQKQIRANDWPYKQRFWSPSYFAGFKNKFCDFQKTEQLFPFKSDLHTKETAATISENYSLSKPSLENEIVTLKSDIFL
jgi:hypothetical protein